MKQRNAEKKKKKKKKETHCINRWRAWAFATN